MQNNSNFMIIFVCLLGGILLQIFLSKQKNKILGYILPCLTFTFSLLITFICMMGVMAGTPILQIFLLFLQIFILYNIPTLVLYGIHKFCHKFDGNNKKIE